MYYLLMKKIILIIISIILISLGSLWFLQGSDIVHLNPILCFANCEPITGKSPLWQIIGVIFVFGGVSLIWKIIKQKELN